MRPDYIVTLGTSFCGSTLLDYLLQAAAREVVSLGEVRTIAMPPADHSRDCVPCEYRARAGEDIGTCWLDETVETIRQTGVARQNIYPTIAALCLGPDEVLHTSDKGSQWVDYFDLQHLGAAWIVLWKPIHKAFASHKSYHPERTESSSPTRYYSVWSREYDRALSRPGRKIVINYDDLTTHTDQVLRGICDVFDLHFDHTWPKTWHQLQLHHRLYGNHGTSARIAQGRTDIYCDCSYRQKLSEAEIADCKVLTQHDPHGTIGRLYEQSFLP